MLDSSVVRPQFARPFATRRLGLRILIWSVSRLQAHSSNFGMDLSLDFHHEIYPLKPADNITVVLASSLSLAATTGEDRERETWRPDGRNDRGLDADYEYVMYGKVRFR